MDYTKLSRAVRAISKTITLVGDFDSHTRLALLNLRDHLKREIVKHKRVMGYKPRKNERKILVEKLDDIFSKFIRLAHVYCFSPGIGAICKCFTCSCLLLWTEMQHGHFVGRKFTAVRWHEDNGRPQCYECNINNEGEKVKFRAALVKDIGEAKVLNLEANKKYYKHSLSELRLLIKYYGDKVKAL